MKSIIEQELERLNEVCIQDHCDECTSSAIQKALEELKKKRFTISAVNYKYELVKWSDVEKSFGEVKDAKNK